VAGAFAVSAGQHFSCAILGDRAAGGRVYCWGLNNFGQAGAPTETRTYPRPMATPLR
jgi:alpha-tubulin suppressor-like RCC1 family protein